MDPLRRNNVKVCGTGSKTLVFSHGYGCDQNMWRHVAPGFEATHRVITFDHVGYGGSDMSAFDPKRLGDLRGYARDVLDVLEALDVRDACFVGHSVSAMIGLLASNLAPERIAELVLVCPSPRYIDDDGYVGGFSRADVEGLLASLDENYLGWARSLAPVIMGNASRPELGQELTASFCRTDPAIASHFAKVTFLSDNREDLPRTRARTLVLQCREDVIAPLAVGEYVHRQISGSHFVLLDATGHCPNLSAPAEVVRAMKQGLRA
jgi:sigma-B regulation protein RsbQ